VWLYAIRNSLKRADLCPWATPVSLQANFSLNNRDPRLVTFMAGAGRVQGRRPYMEDVDFSFDEIRISDKSRVSIFGVLDGHGGGECSKFGAEEIPSNIILHMRGGRLKPVEALFRAFVDADKTYLESSSSRSGSTATVLLWDHQGEMVTVGNSGDTRAVLCRGGAAVDITRDKKATDFEEIARICEEGGFVVNGRVQGSLAVARSLGDRNLKTDNKRFVIADPEITQFRINPDDEFIIIATDGLWDVITSQVCLVSF
jgi:serine/threonine protein phosphatase PrpC